MSSQRKASTKSIKRKATKKRKAAIERKASAKRATSPVPKRAKTSERKTSNKKDTTEQKAATVITKKTDDPKKNPYIVLKKPDLLLLAVDRGIDHANDRNVPTLRRMLAAQDKPFPTEKDLARLRGPSPLPAFAPGLGLGATPPADADEEFAESIMRADSMKGRIESDDSEDDEKDEDYVFEEPISQFSDDEVEGDHKTSVTNTVRPSTPALTAPIKMKAALPLVAVKRPAASRPSQASDEGGALQLLEEMQRSALGQPPVSAINNKASDTAVCKHCHTVFDKAFVQCPGCKVANPAYAASTKRHCSSMTCNQEAMDADTKFCKQCGSRTDPDPMQHGPGPTGVQRASILTKVNQRNLLEGKFLDMELFLPSPSGPSSSVSHSFKTADDGAITITTAAPTSTRKVNDIQLWFEAAFPYHYELTFIEPKDRAEDFLAYMRDATVMMRAFGWSVFSVYDKSIRYERQGYWPACRLMPRSMELAMQAWSLHPASAVVPPSQYRLSQANTMPRMNTGNRATAAFNSAPNNGAKGEICRNYNNSRCHAQSCRRAHVCFAPECTSTAHILKDCTVVQGSRKSELMNLLATSSSASFAARSA